ncbi:MAG TPA: hypothetical protein PLP42_15145 [Acidobacteriota bacterium]|jgi:hypothetical protein|nr:hypothetical protein [Acidobacteriota bacterium]
MTSEIKRGRSNVAAMNPDSNPVLKTIDFGMEVEAFLQSDIGRYLVKRAESEVDSAVETLKEVDPEDAKSVRGLQNTIRVAESIQYWLADAIQSGMNAQVELYEQSKEP